MSIEPQSPIPPKPYKSLPGRRRRRRSSRSKALIAAGTTKPAMITRTSNCGRPTTATRPVEFTMALCMEWNSPAINTLSTEAVGRLLTDETLTSVDDARIVAAGDSAAPSDLPLRMSCQAASPLGAHAADTVLSRTAEEQPRPINVGFFAQCISLGHRAEVVQCASSAKELDRVWRGTPAGWSTLPGSRSSRRKVRHKCGSSGESGAR